MRRGHFSGAVLLAASCTLSCGAGPTGRLTTASNTRGDDPWLAGEGCTPDAPDAAPMHIEVLAAGSGQPVASGVNVRVHYIASLPNGAVLHDSHDSGLPSDIILGSTKTICGFERALLGMRPGEQRRVLVPWSLAFGESGRPPEVPPRTDLVFVIDLYLPAETVIEQGSHPVNPAGGGRRR
jgi:FKBP-type peptidyl-prolyl cis-trans isomerase